MKFGPSKVSVFITKLPLLVSILSCGGGILTKRLLKSITLEDIHLI